ncbi:MAG: glycosyltransferase [Clostridia bacterium]|nr:glycosyltransferase [Clostridia bacterium]
MEKILTIAIPAYNMEKYLAETLKSMIAETIMDDLEVIIVDDGSADKTAEIAAEYVKLYPQTFKLISKENGGHGSALNKGLELATGKYYRPIDADDWVDTDSLVYVINDLKKHNVDMVITNFRKVLEKSGKTINVRCNNVYNRREIMEGKVKSEDNREINIYDYEYDFNRDLYDYAPQYLYHFVTYRTALLKEHNIKFSEKVFYDDMEYDIYPLPYVKTVLPIDRYLYMYRLEREGQSVEDASFIKHRKHRYHIVLSISRYFNDKKKDFGKNVYNHLFPDMVWKAERQYEIYFLSPDDEAAQRELFDFDKELLKVNPEIYSAIKNKAVLCIRNNGDYSKAKAIFLREKNDSENKKRRPKAWTLESDPEMHKMIARRRKLKRWHRYSDEMKKIAALKNSQEGKRCFITCTGPSLTIEDLELLKDEITIGVNSIVKAYEKTDWRPTYYAMVDYFAFGEFLRTTSFPGKMLCKEESFLHYRVDPKNKTGKEIYCLVDYANHYQNRVKAKDILFSDDLSVCAYDAYTVTNFAIQVAIYLGFKEIYIIGADCNYSGSQIHFIEMPDDKVKISAGWLPDALALSIEGYKAAAEFAKKKGVKIFNSTRGGMLEVFPRVSLEEVLRK